jgi:DNA/RNA-binding domain of Phe-tRNA-synthetase-like protein
MEISFTKKYQTVFSELPFGLGWALQCKSQDLKEVKAATLQYIRDNLSIIQQRIDKYTQFFAQNGYQCPLKAQIKTLLQRGFPTINFYVDILLITEMKYGILMGIQDLDRAEGSKLCLDLSEENENFMGFRERISCRKDAIVIRDEKDIIASYFEGPDKKTSVTSTTKNILIYGFFASGIEEMTVKAALNEAVNLSLPQSTKEVKIFYP